MLICGNTVYMPNLFCPKSLLKIVGVAYLREHLQKVNTVHVSYCFNLYMYASVYGIRCLTVITQFSEGKLSLRSIHIVTLYSINCLTVSLPESIMETCSVVLTFESVDWIIWCDHSNENSSAVLLHGTVCFSIFYKMTFGIFLEFWYLALLGVKGLRIVP